MYLIFRSSLAGFLIAAEIVLYVCFNSLSH